MVFVSTYDSPLGEIFLASNKQKLVGLYFVGQKYFARSLPSTRIEKEIDILTQTKRWLEDYFLGKNQKYTYDLELQATSFCLSVWQALQRISYGEVCTYGEIAQYLAKQTGRKIAPRAVGAAVGKNPISIIIPCHRVVAANGLGGYAGGLEKKKALLKLEGADIASLESY